MDPTPTAKDLTLSEDATVVLALARTSLPFAARRAEEGERWLRVLHARPGRRRPPGPRSRRGSRAAASDGRHARGRWDEDRRDHQTLTDVCCRALELADRTGATPWGRSKSCPPSSPCTGRPSTTSSPGTGPPATRSWRSWASSRRSPRPRPDSTRARPGVPQPYHARRRPGRLPLLGRALKGNPLAPRRPGC